MYVETQGTMFVWGPAGCEAQASHAKRWFLLKVPRCDTNGVGEVK